MNLILFGPPGVGKGTQAHRLESLLNVPHIASGDLFRMVTREDTPLAREVRSYMDRGAYVPDDVTLQIVMPRLRKPDARRGFILDGFPRTGGQASALDGALEEVGQRVDSVVYITADADVLVTRIAHRLTCPRCNAVYNAVTRPPRIDTICDVCGHAVQKRSDESTEVVRTRLETYVRETQPVIEYYRQRGSLVEVDGSRPIEQVESEIDEAVGVGRIS